jgi:PIN domain nuclease of toxin-antitoxin system
LRLLLDTHIWLWGLREPDRIGARVRREMADPKNEVWLSPISVWEALTLHEKGRLDLHADVDAWIADATAPFREAPLTHEIAAATRNLLDGHRDPADRFLAATALVLDLTLVTADLKLLGLGEISTLANR